MKKTLYAAVLAGSLLLVGSAALAADPAMMQPVATGTDANTQTMMPTSAAVPVPTSMPNQQAWNNTRPPMRGNVVYNNQGMMDNAGAAMMMRGPQGARGIVALVLVGITMLMGWTIMLLTIIALCKWIKKQSK
ncbi:MAG: hypothetical protein WA001_03005 [Patescibacteria group bacterium]